MIFFGLFCVRKCTCSQTKSAVAECVRATCSTSLVSLIARHRSRVSATSSRHSTAVTRSSHAAGATVTSPQRSRPALGSSTATGRPSTSSRGSAAATGSPGFSAASPRRSRRTSSSSPSFGRGSASPRRSRRTSGSSSAERFQRPPHKTLPLQLLLKTAQESSIKGESKVVRPDYKNS